MDVLVFGSAIVDFICYVDRLPQPGETLHGKSFKTGYGGKGANQCVAAARLGARTAMIAKVGDDAWGKDYVSHMQQEGVNVQHMSVCKEQTTGIAQICVSADGENHIVIVAGANSTLDARDVLPAEQLFDQSKLLLCQLETPVSATLAALKRFQGVSILNAAPALADIPRELLQAASIFCVNEHEAALTSGSPTAITNLNASKTALQALLQLGANTVIITLGELGAVYVVREQPTSYVHVPAPRVAKVLDTTGAGDAFLGSLAYFMSTYADLPLHQQIGAACEVAAHSVQHAGTQSSFPTAAQLNLQLTERQFNWSTF